jgi:two-component system sensor histidine kinase KdpD
LAVAGAVSAFVSISAARAAAAERRQLAAETAALARSDELRASLLRAVSHDLRTPLASIKASVSSLREPDIAWSETDRADFLETIETNTDRLTGIITDLLDLSRLQAGAVQPNLTDASVEEVVAAALDSIDAGDEVRIDLPEDLADVRTDPVLLERVVANLVANAIKWSPPMRDIRIGADRAGDRVELFIIDHGPGIAADQRTLVRRPFQRVTDTGAGGVGLGLAIADQMSTAVGADLRLQDTPGGGLTAVVDLPASGT